MHRIFDSVLPSPGELYQPGKREAEHLFKVFRARPGDEVELLDGRGNRAAGVVEPQRMIRIVRCETVPEPAEKLHLCCALPRRQKLDSLLKQAAELGAWTFRPMRCERSVAEGNPRERWELLLQEACKQSGNPFLPEIYAENKLSDTLSALKSEDIDIFYGSVKAVGSGDSTLPVERQKAILIGPEGGFTDEEIGMIENAGGKPLNLGPHILRLETAAVAALAVLRMLAVMVFCGISVWLFSGCEPPDVNRNPLMIKAEQLRKNGDFADARRFLRQVISRHPESPEGYLALGKLCEEELNDKLEAIYCYRNFLQLAPPEDPRRENAVKFAEALEKEFAAEIVENSDEMQKLRRTNRGLNEELLLAKRLILSNQKKIRQLENKSKAAGKRRSRSKR